MNVTETTAQKRTFTIELDGDELTQLIKMVGVYTPSTTTVMNIYNALCEGWND